MIPNTAPDCVRTKKELKKTNKLKVMAWIPHSPDLYLIELVGGKLDKKVKTKQLTSASHLWTMLQES